MLRPTCASFSPAALCLRCLLDEVLQQLPPAAAGVELPRAGAGEPDEAAGWGGAAERSAALEGELDVRFLLLCCPGLEAARQALQQVISCTSMPQVLPAAQAVTFARHEHSIIMRGSNRMSALPCSACMHCPHAIPHGCLKRAHVECLPCSACMHS